MCNRNLFCLVCRYDGLYLPVSWWIGVDPDGTKYHKFALKRLKCQPPPAWRNAHLLPKKIIEDVSRSKPQAPLVKYTKHTRIQNNKFNRSPAQKLDKNELLSMNKRSNSRKSDIVVRKVFKKFEASPKDCSTNVEKTAVKRPENNANNAFTNCFKPTSKLQTTNISIRTGLYDSSQNAQDTKRNNSAAKTRTPQDFHSLNLTIGNSNVAHTYGKADLTDKTSYNCYKLNPEDNYCDDEPRKDITSWRDSSCEKKRKVQYNLSPVEEEKIKSLINDLSIGEKRGDNNMEKLSINKRAANSVAQQLPSEKLLLSPNRLLTSISQERNTAKKRRLIAEVIGSPLEASKAENSSKSADNFSNPKQLLDVIMQEKNKPLGRSLIESVIGHPLESEAEEAKTAAKSPKRTSKSATVASDSLARTRSKSNSDGDQARKVASPTRKEEKRKSSSPKMTRYDRELIASNNSERSERRAKQLPGNVKTIGLRRKLIVLKEAPKVSTTSDSRKNQQSPVRRGETKASSEIGVRQSSRLQSTGSKTIGLRRKTIVLPSVKKPLTEQDSDDKSEKQSKEVSEEPSKAKKRVEETPVGKPLSRRELMNLSIDAKVGPCKRGSVRRLRYISRMKSKRFPNNVLKSAPVLLRSKTQLPKFQRQLLQGIKVDNNNKITVTESSNDNNSCSNEARIVKNVKIARIPPINTSKRSEANNLRPNFDSKAYNVQRQECKTRLVDASTQCSLNRADNSVQVKTSPGEFCKSCEKRLRDDRDETDGEAPTRSKRGRIKPKIVPIKSVKSANSAFAAVNDNDFRVAFLRSLRFKPITPGSDVKFTAKPQVSKVAKRNVFQSFNKYLTVDTTDVDYMDAELNFEDLEEEDKPSEMRYQSCENDSLQDADGEEDLDYDKGKAGTSANSTNSEQSEEGWPGW